MPEVVDLVEQVTAATEVLGTGAWVGLESSELLACVVAGGGSVRLSDLHVWPPWTGG